MALVAVSSLGATQLHFLEPGVKVNGDYYRNTVLLNMLLLDIRSIFWDYYVFHQDGAPAHRARDTVTMLQRETPEFIHPEMWPPNSPDLNPVDYSIWDLGYASRESTVRGSMMWRSWKMMLLLMMMMSAEGVEAAGPCTTSSRQRLRSGIPTVVWMHVFAWLVDILNIHFEPLTFWCVLIASSILVSVNVIRYKHVQSANIGVKCVTFVCETFTRYDSNITNVWR